MAQRNNNTNKETNVTFGSTRSNKSCLTKTNTNCRGEVKDTTKSGPAETAAQPADGMSGNGTGPHSFVRRLFRRGRSADTGGGHAGRDNDDRDSADTWTTSGTSTSLSPSSIGAGETFGNIALKNSSGVYLGSSTHTHFHGPVTQVVARSRLPPVVQGRAHDQQALLPPAATQDQQHLHDAQRPGQQPELHATVALDLWNGKRTGPVGLSRYCKSREETVSGAESGSIPKGGTPLFKQQKDMSSIFSILQKDARVSFTAV
ncbi:hypothetical protein FOCC_FOCC005558 [Frankliniella occidentalis]|nr:hypothetical protein FOCC_FOCC005558 [Frankliniella occidentalis]